MAERATNARSDSSVAPAVSNQSALRVLRPHRCLQGLPGWFVKPGVAAAADGQFSLWVQPQVQSLSTFAATTCKSREKQAGGLAKGELRRGTAFAASASQQTGVRLAPMAPRGSVGNRRPPASPCCWPWPGWPCQRRHSRRCSHGPEHGGGPSRTHSRSCTEAGQEDACA